MKNLTKGIAAVGALAMLTGVGACGSNTADDKGQVYFLNNKPEVVNQWNELAEMYTKQTGVKVDIQSATSGSYESTLSSELAKNNAPTMFGIGGFDQYVRSEALHGEFRLDERPQMGDGLGGDQGERQGVEDAAILLEDSNPGAEFRRQLGIRDIERGARRGLNDRRRLVGSARIDERRSIEAQVVSFTQGQPWKPAAHRAVADERPATITGEALPGDIGRRQCFAPHRLDGVAP